MTEQLQKVKRVSARSAENRKSNQGLKYLKELELLRKNHDKELSKLQGRKEASADVTRKRYVGLL